MSNTTSMRRTSRQAVTFWSGVIVLLLFTAVGVVFAIRQPNSAKDHVFRSTEAEDFQTVDPSLSQTPIAPAQQARITKQPTLSKEKIVVMPRLLDRTLPVETAPGLMKLQLSATLGPTGRRSMPIDEASIRESKVASARLLTTEAPGR